MKNINVSLCGLHKDATLILYAYPDLGLLKWNINTPQQFTNQYVKLRRKKKSFFHDVKP